MQHQTMHEANKILHDLYPLNRLSVYACVLVNGQDLGLSVNDICDTATLSRPTVSAALRFLVSIELVQEIDRRYYPMQNIFALLDEPERARDDEHRECEHVTRERTDGMRDSRENVKKFFTFQTSSSSTNQLNPDDKTTTTSTRECEKILRSANVRTIDLDLRAMTVERAERIADYIQDNPEKKNSPAGWAYTMLQGNPKWEPPKPKSHHWYEDEYAKFVHGTDDHMQYLRENPDERSRCGCWNDR